jgi:AraC-like DNA-binding protein
VFPYLIPEYSKVESTRVWIDLFQSFYTAANEYTNERTFMRSMKIQSNFQHFIDYFLTFALNEETVPDPRIYKTLEQMEHDLLHGSLNPLEVYYNGLRISRGYFFEMFKKATGFSPNQYINHFRVSRAKDDLRLSKLSITEIAEKYQFSSIHYFSRLFRKFTGQTPREFREYYNSIPDKRHFETEKSRKGFFRNQYWQISNNNTPYSRRFQISEIMYLKIGMVPRIPDVSAESRSVLPSRVLHDIIFCELHGKDAIKDVWYLIGQRNPWIHRSDDPPFTLQNF